MDPLDLNDSFFGGMEDMFDSPNNIPLLEAVILEEQEEEERARQRQSRRRGSTLGREVIPRNREEGHETLWKDYFAERPRYPARLFRRRFRMRRELYLRIQTAVEAHDNYFKQKRNAAGTLGLSCYQKCTAAMRMIAYGCSADAVDDYVRIGESTALESLRRFCNAVNAVFGEQYRRAPNNEDVNRLSAVNKRRGFPGMLGSIDCMHWTWKNCPIAWHGTFIGHIHKPTIILEAVASQDLWIWHSFFGLPGALNDINVLDRSPVFRELAAGRASPAKYSINGHEYTMGYYLADGIYPQWATFVKTIPCPQGNKQKKFAQKQEAARKDVERAFGVLQSRFQIVCGPVRIWDLATIKSIMYACITMHNMIVEDERDTNLTFDYDSLETPTEIHISRDHTNEFIEFLQVHDRIRDRGNHSQLKQDLIEHIWQIYGDE